MTVLWLIISFALHFVIAFALMYCCDKVDIGKWNDGKEIEVYKPSIHNLRFLNLLVLAEDVYMFDKYKLDNYVEKVLKPSHHYFLLKNDLSVYQENEGCVNELSAIVLQVFSLGFIVSNVTKAFPNESMPKLLYGVIIIVVCLAICCTGCYILWKLYKNRLALDTFYFSKESLRERFYYDESEYDVSEEDAFNNFVIEYHYSYLLSIEDSVIFRKNIMKILSALSAIIYFLFFMQIPT